MGSSWLLLALPGSSWLSSWLLLAPPWLPLAPPGSFWLLLVSPTRSWLLLASLGFSLLLSCITARKRMPPKGYKRDKSGQWQRPEGWQTKDKRKIKYQEAGLIWGSLAPHDISWVLLAAPGPSSWPP